jgi:asparagine synthase (glutamine-hydrolysing)
MCGIVCAFDLKQNSETLRPQVLEMSKIIRHRGPDWSGIFSNDKAILSHERLAIVDPASGKQPLFSADGKLVLLLAKSIIIEIYANSLQVNIAFKQKVIANDFSIVQRERTSLLDEMNGIFGFAIYDVDKDEYFVARDHMGIIPLYIGWDQHGTFM